MRYFSLVLSMFFFLGYSSFAQNLSFSGKITDNNKNGIPFATIILKTAIDSTMVKADITTEDGSFTFERLEPGQYFAEADYLGMTDYSSGIIELNTSMVWPDIILQEDVRQLNEVVVTTTRSLVEVKADRTVFNVQGTINSAGENGLDLLRKAPGVLVDNNNNISVLGRAGVLIYVDGKRIPLAGDDLTQYLENLSSEQIDKIDIITNPGSKYEAQGNAGIIDIRLKKDKNNGANASLSGSYGHGQRGRGNINANGNFRNKTFNAFGGIGYNGGANWNEMMFDTYQNGLFLDESNKSVNEFSGYNGRYGTDFFIGKKHTVGFLVGGQSSLGQRLSNNKTFISQETRTSEVDSVLTAPNTADTRRKQATFNLNYTFESGKNRLNIDADYGTFNNDADHFQPNYYYDAQQNNIISQNITAYTTPVEIDIATAKVDFETEISGGRFALGSKFSQVATDNTFLFYNIRDGIEIQNNRRSNQFNYDENVWAGYINYSKSLTKKWNASAGLRIENTNATGDLIAFIPELEEEPVDFNYTHFFPSAGLTYQYKPEHVFSLNYGRRINRPDYNVLNPFREQLSELSYSRGNKFLQPEIVNNVELGYTLAYRFSFKLAYSHTSNQITRLIGPDDEDPRAGFISWDNLATQRLYSLNTSLPFDITKWWNAYMNFGVSHTDNQADYGDGRVVDVQAWAYNIYQQHTFDLGHKWKGEISGWYSGPGVWGGVFLYDPSYSLNIGIQRKFFNNKMNVRLSASDVTFQSGWSGVARFNGQVGFGAGNWDSRRGTVSISYDLGNSQVKSRKRKTSIEDESKRVGE